VAGGKVAQTGVIRISNLTALAPFSGSA